MLEDYRSVEVKGKYSTSFTSKQSFFLCVMAPQFSQEPLRNLVATAFCEDTEEEAADSHSILFFSGNGMQSINLFSPLVLLSCTTLQSLNIASQSHPVVADASVWAF